MASYYANREEFELSFKPTGVRADSNKYRWSGTPGQKNPSRKKSHNRPRKNDAPLNHTTFIHGLSISLATGLWSRLIGTVPVETSSIADFQTRSGGSYAAGSQGSSFSWSWNFLGASGTTGGKRHAEHEGGVVLSEASPKSKLCNPAKLINEYILRKAPDAAVIMSHDDDWSDILGDDSNIGSPADFLQRIDDQFAIVEKDGATFLVSKSSHSGSSSTDNVPALPTLKTEMDSIPSSSGSQIIAGSTRVAKMEAIQAANNEPTFSDARPDSKGRTKDVVSDSMNDAAAETDSPVKRGRGRPKGSKNKKAVAAAAGEGSSSTTPRKRGRPPKGKKDDDEKDTEGEGDEEPLPKRKRGRPPKPPADPSAEPKTRGRPPRAKKPVEKPVAEGA